jgi:V-type H+-transporting ATPase subunit a
MTFPFLFGVMFGDIGHGLLLTIGALTLCFMKDSLKKSDFAALVQARYLLVFMGIFATYCGFLYNDFLSLPINFFGSCYSTTYLGPCYEQTNPDKPPAPECYYPLSNNHCVYPFGKFCIYIIQYKFFFFFYRILNKI